MLANPKQFRLGLLGGLLDSDGHLSRSEERHRHYVFTQACDHKSIADLAQRVARSLGARCDAYHETYTDPRFNNARRERFAMLNPGISPQ